MNEALRAKVLDLMNRHGIGYFDYQGPDGVLTLDTDLPQQEHPPILARTAGIFLWRHPADHSAAVWPRHVRGGEILGWLKIGPLLEPVCAEEEGLVRRPKLPDGTLAGYGDRLF